MLYCHSPHSASTRMKGNCLVSPFCRVWNMLIVFLNILPNLLMDHGQSADTENYQRKVSKFEFIEMKIEIFSINSDTDTLFSCMHISFLCVPSMVRFQCYHRYSFWLHVIFFKIPVHCDMICGVLCTSIASDFPDAFFCSVSFVV